MKGSRLEGFAMDELEGRFLDCQLNVRLLKGESVGICQRHVLPF